MEGMPYVARLSELLEDLHTITSFRLSLHDLDGTEWYAAKKRTAFCDLICDTEEGYRRCLTCDRRAITAFGQLGRPIQYRCHAGLVDTAVPVVEHGAIVAVILFGQIVDDSPMDKQWAIVQKKCAWYHDMPALERAFYQVPRVSARQIKAFVAVLGACVGNLSLVHGDMNAQTDQQRLRSYVSIHYSSPLTLDGVAKALGMSRSKLCQVAAAIQPGMTLMKLVTQRRVDMARHLLTHSDAPVRDVAGRVGMADYNYFTKVFKRAAGVSPSQYRKLARTVLLAPEEGLSPASPRTRQG